MNRHYGFSFRFISATLLSVVLLLAPATSFAQSRSGEFKGSIPFWFVAGNQTLPAGRYTITPLGETTFRIQSAGKTAVVVQTHSTEQKEPSSATRMVFQRRGDAYVLSELWIAGNRIGRQLFVPSGEKQRTMQDSEEIAVVLPAK